ncbi:MAG: hypothetical protein KJT01_06825 [Gemmatimonadetes bacterium]|nr:hypothetical protein [Gemmatimonadota bacterium]
MAPGVVDSLPVGSYSVAMGPVSHGALRYLPIDTTLGVVVAPAQVTAVTLAYQLVPTILDVVIDGLAANTAANVVLTAPDGERYTPARTQRFLQVLPGAWTMQADTVTSLVARHAPTPSSASLQLAAGDTGRVAVQYAVITGSLAVAAIGLPSGAWGAITVNGPDGTARALSGTATVTHLRPGRYTVSASEVTVGGTRYAPTPAFTVNGPVTRTRTGPGRLDSLPIGGYTIAAGAVEVQGIRYTPAPAAASAAVTAGGTASVHFDYAGGDGGSQPNVVLRTVYAVQAVQTPDGTVPLVAGRPALLRAFITANNDANSHRPRVTFRLFDAAGMPLLTQEATWPTAGVRTFADASRYDATLNVAVDGAVVRPGVRLLVEIDPASVPDDSRTDDNVWPRAGVPQPLPVVSPPPFAVRFVPVTVGNATGRVDAATVDQYLTLARRLFPLQEVTASVRAPFTATVPQLTPTGTAGWSQVLSELNALRTADGAPAGTHYFGVVRPGYGAGIAGVGYVPGWAALGWDDAASAGTVAAHEWGHNFGRLHAPCGTAGDGQYPYADGIIGHFGWVPGTTTIVPATATDIMGYCDSPWVSDYTWNAVLTHRATAAPLRAGDPADGLLVWGRVTAGRVELEPAFRVRAPITPEPTTGTHRLQLLAQDGAALTSVRVRPVAVADAAPGDAHFALVVPYSAALERAVRAVRVTDVRAPLRSALRTGGPSGTVAQEGADAVGVELDARGVRVRWQGGGVAMALVRDATSGTLLGFVRRSGETVATGGRRVEVVVSDGVRSAVRRPE